MNTLSIQRADTGPASQDRTSAAYFDNESAYAEREIRTGFGKAVELGDANALCPWAGTVTDWDAARKLPTDQKALGNLPKRAQTFTECMSESLDYSDGPSMTEAMQLILNAARCSDDALSEQARRLLENMGESFSYHNC